MKPKKSSEGLGMRELVASVAGPRSWGDTRESWLARAARRAGISPRQAKSLFYAEITDPNHRSARLMRDAAQRYEAIAQTLNAEIYSGEVAQLLDLVRQLRDEDAAERPRGALGPDE